MSRVTLKAGLYGILQGFDYSPETAKPMLDLVTSLMNTCRGTLCKAEREMIAAFVSGRNQCEFCLRSHAAIAKYLLGGDDIAEDYVVEALQRSEKITRKLKSLLDIAEEVRSQSLGMGPKVDELVAIAKAEGNTETDIHDTVLITAAFCMYNRYVEGLATTKPADDSIYQVMGEQIANNGYHLEDPIIKAVNHPQNCCEI